MTTAPQANEPLNLRDLIGATTPDKVFTHLKMLIYGEPGAGKTHLFGTVADLPDEFLPALLIDIDGGTATIRHRTSIHVKSIRSIEALKDLFEKIAADPHYYKSLGLDNLSELQKIDMNSVMKEAKESSNNPEKVDIYVPSQREWGKSGERMRIIVRSFRDLPCHVFMFAHLDEREDSATKIMRISPSLPGKLRHELAGFFDVVGMISTYESNGEVFRQIQFAKTRRVAAKDRFSALPSVMTENPTIPHIWDAITTSDKATDDATPVEEVVIPPTSDAVIAALSQQGS